MSAVCARRTSSLICSNRQSYFQAASFRKLSDERSCCRVRGGTPEQSQLPSRDRDQDAITDTDSTSALASATGRLPPLTNGFYSNSPQPAPGYRDPDKWLFKRLLDVSIRRVVQLETVVRLAIDRHQPEVSDRVRELRKQLRARALGQAARYEHLTVRFQSTPLGAKVAESVREFVEQSAKAKEERDEYLRRVQRLKPGEKI